MPGFVLPACVFPFSGCFDLAAGADIAPCAVEALAMASFDIVSFDIASFAMASPFAVDVASVSAASAVPDTRQMESIAIAIRFIRISID